MKRTLKTTSFIIINFAILGALGLALFLYTSCFESVSWYIPEEIKFLAFYIIINPLLGVTGTAIILLGLTFPIPTLNKLIPFLSLAEFYSIFVLKPTRLYFLLLGYLINISLFVLLIYTMLKTIILIRDEKIELN